MQNIGFGSTGVCRKEISDICGLKSRGIFTFLFPSSPPFSFFLFSVFGPGNLFGLISVGNVLGNSRPTGLEGRKCRWVVEDFHPHFRLNV